MWKIVIKAWSPLYAFLERGDLVIDQIPLRMEWFQGSLVSSVFTLLNLYSKLFLIVQGLVLMCNKIYILHFAI